MPERGAAGVDRDGEAKPAYLVRGDDPSVLADAARALIAQLVGNRDPGMVVEEQGGVGPEEPDLGMVVDALTTPPFLTDRRVVVFRDAGRLKAGDVGRLVACIEDPVPEVIFVAVGGGGTLPPALVKAVEKHGEVLGAAVGTGRARTQWFDQRLRDAPVRLDGPAAVLLGKHLGGDVARLRGLLENLTAAYGPGARITAEQLEPFLGQAGSVAPWDLTDAIDAGKEKEALNALDRLLRAGGFHPLALMTILHRHIEAMLRLDGAGAHTAEDAARVLASKGTFMAGKALEQGRRMGSDRIARAVTFLAQADLDIRGASALAPEVVLEILVARLSRLSPAGPRRGAPPGRPLSSSRSVR
jgi:DNA polymerase-3 subunit delta